MPLFCLSKTGQITPQPPTPLVSLLTTDLLKERLYDKVLADVQILSHFEELRSSKETSFTL